MIRKLYNSCCAGQSSLVNYNAFPIFPLKTDFKRFRPRLNVNKTLREETESVKKQLRQANTNLKRARSDRDSYKELLNSCQVSFETLQGKYDDLKKQTVTDPQNHADLIKEIAILKRELKSEKENANIIARMSGFENILSDLRGERKPAQQATTQHQGQAQGDCKLMRIIPLNK